MRRLRAWFFAAVALVVLAAGPAVGAGARAQDEPTPAPDVPGQPSPLRQTLLQAALEELPEPPAFIRLVRITLQPGASVPLHTHPGPEFGRVETGTLTVFVDGEAAIALATRDDTPQPPRIPPVAEEFDLQAGDQIVYPSEVPLSFSNRSPTEATTLLAVVVLPAGNQRPPGAAWVNGTPGSDAFEGVTSQILGDAVAPGWPAGSLAVVLDRLALAPGESIPPRGGPVMLTVELGQFAFASVEGDYQVYEASSGLQGIATPGAASVLDPGDAVFFPGGMNEVPRPDDGGVLVVLRLSVLPTDGTDATGGDTGTITGGISAEAGRTPVAGAETGFAVDDTVTVTAVGVRLRDQPSVEGAVVTELDQGRELIVEGPPVAGGGIRWYPVSAADDPALLGFIAEEFLALSE